MTDPRVCRSWLFAPGDSPRKMEKSWSTGADALIFDLEDACAPGNKVAARELIVNAVTAAGDQRTGVQLYIRINEMDTGAGLEDVRTTFGCRPDGYFLPKVDDPVQIQTISWVLQELEMAAGVPVGTTTLVPIVTENARAVMRLYDLCRADPRVRTVLWGSEDLAADIGARRVKRDDGSMLEVFKTVRSLALLAGAAAGVGVIDTPVVEVRDVERLTTESREAAWMGFTGKLAIHPTQVSTINTEFTPDVSEVERAQQIVALLRTKGRDGVVTLDGRMVDAAHLKAAERRLARAAAYTESLPRSDS